MQTLYDFGVSQEDPRTEFQLLDLQENDRLLCIASGGEMPISLLCYQPSLKITAVDISLAQLYLCKLKMQVARSLPFPINGKFLGYGWYDSKRRREIYLDEINKLLSKDEQRFWIKNLIAIEEGVVHKGKFEIYLKNLRWMFQMLIGKTNLNRLLACMTLEEQTMVFEEHIDRRKGLSTFFKIAFHPSVYKNRGLREEAMLHSSKDTGIYFFNKFKDFCTKTLVSENYFFQFFLTGSCNNNDAYPDYLREKNRLLLDEHADNIHWKNISLQGELAANNPGYYNKIHLSNIGDWLSSQEFKVIMDIVCRQCIGDERMVYRYLQKNHFISLDLCDGKFNVQAVDLRNTDRFPFYELLTISSHGRNKNDSY